MKLSRRAHRAPLDIADLSVHDGARLKGHEPAGIRIIHPVTERSKHPGVRVAEGDGADARHRVSLIQAPSL